MRIKLTRLIHGALILAVASLAACGGGGGGGGGSSEPSATTYTIGGTVTGLTGTVVLQNNGGDNLSVSANGAFTFATKLANGASYAVTVLTQPAGQICSVNPYSGSVSAANVTSVAVTCAATSNTFTVGGSVTGLTGTGLVLQNNGGDNLSVSSNGAFTFATPVANGANYAVTVLTQPSGQTCTVNPYSGTVSGSNITSVAVTCSSSAYTVGGSVTGLTGTVVLQNNGGDNLSISTNGAFTFATPVASGAAYSVAVLTQPAGQTCSVSTASGTVSTANVTSVAVTCASTAATTYTIGGNVTGLTGTGLVLQEGGTSHENLPIDASGNFTFVTQFQTGNPYVVQVLTNPVGQTCSVTSGGVGMVGSANVTTISVSCSANTYSIGGMLSGLTGDGLVLQNNGGDNLTVAAGATAFTFITPIANGSTYDVTILTQPTGQICNVDVPGNTGTVNGAAVTDVSVICSADTYTIGVTVNGLTGTVVLQNNGGDDLSISADGTFAFSAALPYNSTYSVSVLTQPTLPQICTVANGTGTVTADVTNVSVTCVNAYTISGTIFGADNGVGPILQNNGGDNLFIPTITTTGTQFTFTTPVADGGGYSITQLARARAPAQDCRASTPMPVTGTVNGGNVTFTDVTITCQLSTIVPSFAYVANGNDSPALNQPDTVSAFTISAGGDLMAATTPTAASGDQPYAVAVEPTGRFVYAVNSDSDSVSVYGIGAGGVLTMIDADGSTSGTEESIPTGDTPKSIAIHPSGKFAYVLNQGNNATATVPTGRTLSAYSINETTGALTAIDADQAPGTQATIATGANPYEVAVDSLGRFAYVANYDADTISAYKIDTATGALTSVGTAVTAGDGPSSIAVDPTGTCALVTNHLSDQVMAYEINPTTGALTLRTTVTGATGIASPRSIAVDPDTGLYAYVANSSGSVSAYSITPAGCIIAEINADAGGAGPTIAAGTVPLSIDVDPSGQFVYVANFGVFDGVNRTVVNAGSVSVYSINAGTGALTPVGTPIAAGSNPTSVATTE